jgi:hypothetical protein
MSALLRTSFATAALIAGGLYLVHKRGNDKFSRNADVTEKLSEDELLNTAEIPVNDYAESVGKNETTLAYYRLLESMTSAHGVQYSFKSLHAAILVLKISFTIDSQLKDYSRIRSFIDYLDTVVRELSIYSEGSFAEFPKVVVIEGLPGTGKTTLIKELVRDLGFRQVEVTRANLIEIRHLLSSTSPAIISAFDHIVNYCLAHSIITESSCGPTDQVFIIERFYHHTCMRSICKYSAADTNVNSLPASLFEWPLDLPQPSLVRILYIFLLFFY